MSYIFPPEYSIPLFVLGVVFFMLGLRSQSGGAFLLAGSIVFYPLYREFMLIFFPTWVFVVVTGLGLVLLLKYVLELFIGHAANETVGALVADSIRYMLRLPFRLIKSLSRSRFFRRVGLVGSHGLDTGYRKAKRKLAAGMIRSRGSAQAKRVEIGRVVGSQADRYLVEIKDNLTGIYLCHPEIEGLSIGEVVECDIGAQIQSGVVTVEGLRRVSAEEEHEGYSPGVDNLEP